MNDLNIFNRKHIMFDTETLSTRQNAVIVSIGAVSFTFEKGIEHEFLVNVDPIDCHKLGLHIEKSTVDWWSKQPKEVSDLWKVSPKPLKQSLEHFNDFVGTDSKQFIWAHGAVFDLGIIKSAFDTCKLQRNWKYYNEMDSRTIFNLLGIRNDKIRATEKAYHSALDDARSQANTLISAFN